MKHSSTKLMYLHVLLLNISCYEDYRTKEDYTCISFRFMQSETIYSRCKKKLFSSDIYKNDLKNVK